MFINIKARNFPNLYFFKSDPKIKFQKLGFFLHFNGTFSNPISFAFIALVVFEIFQITSNIFSIKFQTTTTALYTVCSHFNKTYSAVQLKLNKAYLCSKMRPFRWAWETPKSAGMTLSFFSKSKQIWYRSELSNEALNVLVLQGTLSWFEVHKNSVSVWETELLNLWWPATARQVDFK